MQVSSTSHTHISNILVAINVKIIIIIIIYLFTAIGLLPGGCGYFTCIQNMKLVTTKFKLGGLHEKHVVQGGNNCDIMADNTEY